MTRHGTILLLVCLMVGVGCGAGGDGDHSSGGGGGGDQGGPTESGDCVGGGWCGDSVITLKADLSGAEALFTLQDTSSSVLALTDDPQGIKKATISDQSKFFKLLDDGTYEEVISAISGELSEAPRISAIACSDLGDCFIAYEHPFMYRQPPESYRDPSSPSSPYTCQLFKVASTIPEFVELGAGADTSLCCVTNTLQLDTWDYRMSQFQFDSAGNMYFTAHVPQNWKNVLVKWSHSSTPELDEEGVCTYPTSSLSEEINANIVYRDYVVVPTGGIFYTGFTSTSGDFHDGDSFLRFKSGDDELQEITSGWWDYIFQPVDVEDTLLGVDASLSATTSDSERVIFFGPDPLDATSPDWNDSCLFLYDPNKSGTERSTEIADCQIDVWNYVEWADTLALRRAHCTETKYMLGDHNQPKRIILSDSYDADGNYVSSDDYVASDGKEEIFVVGDVHYKREGEWRYDLRIEESHCVVDDVPDYTYNGNQAGCTTNGGTWEQDVPKGYNQLHDADLLDDVEDGNDTNWVINSQWCESPGGDWKYTYSGIARVNYDGDDDSKSITFLSDRSDEIVKDGWAVNDRLFYVAFNTVEGEYHLLEVGNSDPLLTGYEVYELFKHPNDVNKLYFNGLRFSDNRYVMGTFDPRNADGTLSVETGITGQIEKLIVIPDNLLQ